MFFCSQFLDFITEVLREENPKFIELVQKRWDYCNTEYRDSPQMVTLLEETQRGMETEKPRMFVHLKDLINELKAHGPGKKSKMKQGSPSTEDKTAGQSSLIHQEITCARFIRVQLEDCSTWLHESGIYKVYGSLPGSNKRCCSIGDGRVAEAEVILARPMGEQTMLGQHSSVNDFIKKENSFEIDWFAAHAVPPPCTANSSQASALNGGGCGLLDVDSSEIHQDQTDLRFDELYIPLQNVLSSKEIKNEVLAQEMVTFDHSGYVSPSAMDTSMILKRQAGGSKWVIVKSPSASPEKYSPRTCEGIENSCSEGYKERRNSFTASLSALDSSPCIAGPSSLCVINKTLNEKDTKISRELMQLLKYRPGFTKAKTTEQPGVCRSGSNRKPRRSVSLSSLNANRETLIDDVIISSASITNNSSTKFKRTKMRGTASTNTSPPMLEVCSPTPSPSLLHETQHNSIIATDESDDDTIVEVLSNQDCSTDDIVDKLCLDQTNSKLKESMSKISKDSSPVTNHVIHNDENCNPFTTMPKLIHSEEMSSSPPTLDLECFIEPSSPIETNIQSLGSSENESKDRSSHAEMPNLVLTTAQTSCLKQNQEQLDPCRNHCEELKISTDLDDDCIFQGQVDINGMSKFNSDCRSFSKELPESKEGGVELGDIYNGQVSDISASGTNDAVSGGKLNFVCELLSLCC